MQSLFAITPTTSDVVAGGTIPLEQPARRISPVIQLSSNSITIPGGQCRAGYYKVSGTVTLSSSATGVAQIELHKNGAAFPGIVAQGSIDTATTQVITLPIEGIVRVEQDEIAVLTLVNAGIAITVSNVALVVERIY